MRDPIGIAGWPLDKGRDGQRTPMQWTPGPQAGFSASASTWLPVGPDHATVNVESGWADPNSLLNWTARLIALRRSEPALAGGAMTVLDGTPGDVLAWTRSATVRGAGQVLVAINMGGAPRELSLRSAAAVTPLAASDPMAVVNSAGKLVLPGFGIWVGRLK